MALRFSFSWIIWFLLLAGCSEPITEVTTINDAIFITDSLPLNLYDCYQNINVLNSTISNLNYISWKPDTFNKATFYWSSENLLETDELSITVPHLFRNSLTEYPVEMNIRANEAGQTKMISKVITRMLIDTRTDVCTIKFCEIPGALNLENSNYKYYYTVSGYFQFPRAKVYQ